MKHNTIIRNGQNLKKLLACFVMLCYLNNAYAGLGAHLTLINTTPYNITSMEQYTQLPSQYGIKRR